MFWSYHKRCTQCRDVTVVLHHQDRAIFYKELQEDLEDIEFYTNSPCFVYIESGQEVLTNSEQASITLEAGSGIFLPQGIKLHSDFVKLTHALKAYLVFFNQDNLQAFLSMSKSASKTTAKPTTSKPTTLSGSRPSDSANYCLITSAEKTLTPYFASLKNGLQSPAFFKSQAGRVIAPD